MNKFIFLMGVLFFFGFASGIPVTQLDSTPLDSKHQTGQVHQVGQTEVSYFYSVGCAHCEVVAESGILDDVSEMEGVSVGKYETTSPVNRERYLGYLEEFEIEGGGIPFLVVEQGG